MQIEELQKTIDNKKSWVSDDEDLRIATDAGYESYYYLDSEKLVLNVKNVDLRDGEYMDTFSEISWVKSLSDENINFCSFSET